MAAENISERANSRQCSTRRGSVLLAFDSWRRYESEKLITLLKNATGVKVRVLLTSFA